MKVGDYVRTYSGDIGILINCPEQLKNEYGNMLWLETMDEQRPLSKKEIKLSSPNIIDLIELRDIVELYEESWFDNGVEKEDTGYYEVLAYTTDRKEIGVRNKDGEIDWYPAENLRGIITYEQIESMEYKINE